MGKKSSTGTAQAETVLETLEMLSVLILDNFTLIIIGYYRTDTQSN